MRPYASMDIQAWIFMKRMSSATEGDSNRLKHWLRGEADGLTDRLQGSS